MKKFMKKISALLITAMVLVAMVIPASAATITIENADDATLKMVQVIAVDPTSETGWKFVNGEDAFIEALGAKDADGNGDAQLAIAMLIKMASPSAVLPSRFSTIEAATEAQLQTALSKMEITGTFSYTVDDAGMYAIRATEEGYTYQDMAVYVDFEGATTPETLTAKKSTTDINKEITNEEAKDQAVAIGDTITYTVTSNFPYIKPNTLSKYYEIKDTLTGATYDKDSFVITIGGNKLSEEEIAKVLTFDSEDNSFTVSLSEYIKDDNKNASKPVVITYSATVTATDIKNTVAHNGNGVTGSDDVNVYTGTITLTKYGESQDTLKGAGFNVTKDGGKDVLTFVQDVDDDGKVIGGKYTYDPAGTITEVVTAADGTLEVKGLDEGGYHFAEITAPDGYSINEEGADATLANVDENDNEIAATAIFTDDTNLKDTKLSALPSTGSVGTYLFTIIGVGVMAVMVSLFTIKRRRDARA